MLRSNPLVALSDPFRPKMTAFEADKIIAENRGGSTERGILFPALIDDSKGIITDPDYADLPHVGNILSGALGEKKVGTSRAGLSSHQPSSAALTPRESPVMLRIFLFLFLSVLLLYRYLSNFISLFSILSLYFCSYFFRFVSPFFYLLAFGFIWFD